MTIVASGGADAYIRRLPPAMRLFLIHGQDEGLIHERSREIVQALLGGHNDPMRLTRIDGAAAARDPGVLSDEALAVSMFGGDKVIWIETQGRDMAAAVEPLVKSPPERCSVVIEAGALKKGVALRVLFEKSDRAASIECYSDDRRALGPLIEAQAREAGLRIAPDARDALAALLGADRMTTRAELAKLMVYAQGREAIELADVEAIVADAAPDAIDDVVDCAFSGDSAAIEAAAGRFFSEGGDAGLLLIMLTRRLVLLHRVKLEMDAGAQFEAAIHALYVRLAPPRKRALEHQASRWSKAKLEHLLPALRSASARVRRDTKMAEFTAMRTLWALGSSARSAA